MLRLFLLVVVNIFLVDLFLLVVVVEELVFGLVIVMVGDFVCRGDTDRSWGRLGLVGSEDDVEEDLEVLFWFFGE